MEVVDVRLTAGAIPVGGLADGADVTQGAKADAAATSDTGSFSLIALVKRLLGLNSPKPASGSDVHIPSSNTAAVVTYAAAGSGVSHVLGGISWSYNATPTGGNIKIEDGATTVLSLDITSAGPGYIPFARAKKGTANTALVVTLAAGGSGVSGKLSILSHWTE
jgi:hypothetical protein